MKVELNGHWNMRRLGTDSWVPATVPGSVFHDLLREGLIEDPYYRANEEDAEEIALGSYEYTRSFQLEGAWRKQDRLVLVCEGLNTLATVEVNGVLVAKTDNMHRTYELDVKPHVQDGDNTIRIVFASSLAYIRERQEKEPIWGQPHTLAGFPHLRKASYMFGWDWGPVIPDMGIWRDVYIEGQQDVRVMDIHVRQIHEPDWVTLDARIETEVLTAGITGEIEFAVLGPDRSESTVRDVLQSAVSLSLPIRDPKLWWPSGYGAQELYTCTVRVIVDENVIEERTFTLGLRTIELRREKDEWGESFEFVVNDIPVFIKGANYIPEDNLTGRYSEDRTDRLVDDCRRANFNLIRVWGGGLYPGDSFYEACNRHGMLVWQDFMFACANYSLDGGMADNIREEASDQVRRLRHQACLALWCGNNEIEMAWVDWGIPQEDKLKRDHVELFERLLPSVVDEFDPDTAYWPSSPSSGGGFDVPNDEHRGDAHYWDVWHGLKPFTDYRNFHFRFVSEFGFQSFPELKTVESYTLPEDRNIFSYVMEKHQKNDAANGKILYYLSELYRYPTSFDGLLYVSQLLQAEAIKYGVEHWRRHRGRCMGTVYWQLNDCWPVASWASIDYYHRWKALHYYAKRFYAPELVSAAEEGTTVPIWLVNDRLQPVSGELRWQLCHSTGRIVDEGSLGVELGAASAREIWKLDFADRAAADRGFVREHAVTFQWTRDGETISEGSVLFCPPKHFEWEEPALSFTVDELDWYWVVKVEALALARSVELRFVDADYVWEDNFFDLIPGHAKSLVLDKTKAPFMNKEELARSLVLRSIVDSYK